jgi:hypothetical protein
MIVAIAEAQVGCFSEFRCLPGVDDVFAEVFG